MSADLATPAEAAADLRRAIADHYGSAAKFAALINIHKSTLSRILSGYYGRASLSHWRDIIAARLAADGVVVVASAPPTAARAAGEIDERISGIAHTARLAHRYTTDPVVQGALALITRELEALRGLMEAA